MNLSLDKIYNIPQEMYINIVLHTISNYIKDNRFKADCILVVDNDNDEELVRAKLKIKHLI